MYLVEVSIVGYDFRCLRTNQPDFVEYSNSKASNPHGIRHIVLVVRTEKLWKSYDGNMVSATPHTSLRA